MYFIYVVLCAFDPANNISLSKHTYRSPLCSFCHVHRPRSPTQQRTCFIDAEAVCIVIIHVGISRPSVSFMSSNFLLCEESSLLQPLLKLPPCYGVLRDCRGDTQSQLRLLIRGKQVQKCPVCKPVHTDTGLQTPTLLYGSL